MKGASGGSASPAVTCLVLHKRGRLLVSRGGAEQQDSRGLGPYRAQSWSGTISTLQLSGVPGCDQPESLPPCHPAVPEAEHLLP